jgi:hypothetical protein
MATTNFDGLNLKVSAIAEGAAGNHTVTGITTADKILSVAGATMALSEGTPNTIDYTAVNLTAEFSITAANTINNTGGTSLADGWALVVWLDVDAA